MVAWIDAGVVRKERYRRQRASPGAATHDLAMMTISLPLLPARMCRAQPNPRFGPWSGTA